jgi:hypothetical protein
MTWLALVRKVKAFQALVQTASIWRFAIAVNICTTIEALVAPFVEQVDRSFLVVVIGVVAV